MGDEGFIRAIAEHPDHDTTLLVYADWLEERDDPEAALKAEFLRLTVAERAEDAQRLQQLAADLDTSWLAVVSRPRIENCGQKRAETGRRAVLRFDFLCDRRWEELDPTEDQAVRFCDGCQQSVHYCDTIMEARRQTWAGHCIAVDLGVIRRQGDLEPPRIRTGKVSADSVRREQGRRRPDPVSAERERRKRDAGRADHTTSSE